MLGSGCPWLLGEGFRSPVGSSQGAWLQTRPSAAAGPFFPSREMRAKGAYSPGGAQWPCMEPPFHSHGPLPTSTPPLAMCRYYEENVPVV